jgi:hypothetical protein
MTKLMKQLQAWANQGLIVFPEGDYKGGLNVPIESLSPYGGKPEWKCTKDAWKLYHDRWVHTFGGYLQLVLDGTIQVWRPVEHYPLIENNKPVILWRKGIRNGIVAVWSLEFGSCFTDCEWRDFKTQEIIEDIEDYTHWMPFEPPQEVSHV